MANLSQEKRKHMLAFLKKIKESNQDEDTIIAINEIENELNSKKYGLVWEQHEEAVDIKMRTHIPVFTEVKEREIQGNPNSVDYNFLIEGDNLHSLKLLEKTHRGSIDVIYIDPPYNTMSQAFIYDDAIVDSDDGFKHSKWLSFMSERLSLARELLKSTGFIMISINDIELFQLKLLCDSIFGESNFLANMIWQSTPGSNTGLDIKTVTEYVLCYAKKKDKCLTSSQPVTNDSKYDLSDEYEDRRGKHTLNKLDRRMTGHHYSDALNYQIEMPDGTLLYPGSNETKQPNWNWRWSKDKVDWGIKNGFIVFRKGKNNKWAVYFKQYFKVDNNDNLISRSLPYQNLIKELEGANSARGTQEIMQLFDSKVFDYPKPLNLIKYLLRIHQGNDIKVLDFFAGSGTTGQAVAELNTEDGGNRSFILCTNNENNICEQVTYERLKRVCEGYSDNAPTPFNLKYYKTDFIEKEQDDDFYSVEENLLEHIKELIQLERGISLDNDDYLLALTEEDIENIEKNPESLKNCEAIYISGEVLLTKEQETLFQGIELITIPQYYFESELIEVGEI